MTPGSSLEITVATAVLARAAAQADRLLPSRAATPGGVLLGAADRSGVLELSAAEGELAVRTSVPATVHQAGEAAVSRRALAATLAGLDVSQVRLQVEGSRLAVRTPAARFALPLLDRAAFARPVEQPAAVGEVDGAVLRSAGLAVAGAASRDGLPIFTGVRVRSAGERLSLVATDRFRMAAANLPWRPAAGCEVDALVPATILAEVARQAGSLSEVLLRSEAGRFGFDWAGSGLVTAGLALPFPDAQIDRLLRTRPECTAEVNADLLLGAVERAVPFSGSNGHVFLDVADGGLVVRSGDTSAGEAREEVKAGVRGGLMTACYQGRYLLDALRVFAGDMVVVQFQEGILPTVVRAAQPGAVELSYLVVPLRTRE
jgi:DNA polymerase-3 subunit beta